MAILTTINCQICHQEKTISHSVNDYPTICGECQDKQIQSTEEAHISELKKLTLEQRIERIERTQYQDQQRQTPWDWDQRIR